MKKTRTNTKHKGTNKPRTYTNKQPYTPDKTIYSINKQSHNKIKHKSNTHQLIQTEEANIDRPHKQNEHKKTHIKQNS